MKKRDRSKRQNQDNTGNLTTQKVEGGCDLRGTSFRDVATKILITSDQSEGKDPGCSGEEQIGKRDDPAQDE